MKYWLLTIFFMLRYCICGHEDSIIDMFTIISKPSEYAYISKGDFWLSLHLMNTLSSPANDSSRLRIHIFTDTNWIMEHGQELGYHMYNISSNNKRFRGLYNKFMDVYRPNHHSINTVEYEFLCFYRWHLFRSVMDDWNAQN